MSIRVFTLKKYKCFITSKVFFTVKEGTEINLLIVNLSLLVYTFYLYTSFILYMLPSQG